MAEKIRMAQAVEDFLLFRKAGQKSVATVKNDRMVLRRLFLITGDIFVASLTERHINTALSSAAVTRSSATLGIDHATLSKFCDWAVRNRFLHQLDNPMHGRKAPRSMPTERQRLPMKDFDRLLDAAGAVHPRNRMVLALGLYLFLRAGEITDLKLGDILPRLDHGEIAVRIFKTRQIDVMPVCAELDRELRSWLSYYAREAGPLRQDWYLVPAKNRARWVQDPRTRLLVPAGGPVRLRPDHRITKVEEIVQRALREIGFATHAPDGATLREGVHTLRRSGARALFDVQRELGYDGAIRHVQAMLHHANMSQTEHYLGLTLDRVKRNELTKGRPMFDTGDAANVVQIREVAGGQGRTASV